MGFKYCFVGQVPAQTKPGAAMYMRVVSLPQHPSRFISKRLRLALMQLKIIFRDKKTPVLFDVEELWVKYSQGRIVEKPGQRSDVTVTVLFAYTAILHFITRDSVARKQNIFIIETHCEKIYQIVPSVIQMLYMLFRIFSNGSS